jgi:cell division protein FtsN
MSGNGAYEGEMNEVVLFENALRAAVPTRPSPTLGTTLVPRLAEVARASTIEAETRATQRRTAPPRSRFALVARVGIVVALIPLVLAGLAFAGVTVPGPARSAFDSVGISLPNQPAKHASAAGHGQGATHRHRGTGSATTTSKGNSAAAHQHALEQHNKARGKALGHEKGKAIGLNGSTPPGQAKKEPKTHPSHPTNSGGNSATHTTTHTTPQHTTPEPTPPTTPGNGNGHSK